VSALPDDLIFFPPPPSYDRELEGLVRLESASGDSIAACHRVTPGSDVTVLFAHGNAEDVGDGALFLDRYARLGVSVLAFDYPGYGLSTGRPSEDGAYRAADVAYRYLLAARARRPRRSWRTDGRWAVPSRPTSRAANPSAASSSRARSSPLFGS
jgi:pimeloyl-ACP methyl ester carboxylesterase